MKSIALQLIAIVSFTLLLSCGSTPQQNAPQPKQETPEALKDNGELDIKSYSRSSNLVEELYQELLGKNPELKKLENQLNDNWSNSNQTTEKFTAYNTKSTNYYNAAENTASTITDTVLQKKVLAFIKSSNKQYDNKTAQLNSLLTQISLNNASINDHHAMLKIFLTLPLIESYQNSNIPNKKDFADYIKNQQQLIDKINKALPNSAH
jgi:hypothetical protein